MMDNMQDGGAHERATFFIAQKHKKISQVLDPMDMGQAANSGLQCKCEMSRWELRAVT